MTENDARFLVNVLAINENPVKVSNSECRQALLQDLLFDSMHNSQITAYRVTYIMILIPSLQYKFLDYRHFSKCMKFRLCSDSNCSFVGRLGYNS